MAETLVGPRPSGITISLAYDADFALVVRSEGAPYDLDALISLRFPVGDQLVTWTATIGAGDPYRAIWDVDETDVAALLALGKPRTVRLHYERGAVDLLWDVWRVVVV